MYARGWTFADKAQRLAGVPMRRCARMGWGLPTPPEYHAVIIAVLGDGERDGKLVGRSLPDSKDVPGPEAEALWSSFCVRGAVPG